MHNGLNRQFQSVTDCISSLYGIQSQIQQFAEVSIFNRCYPIIDMKQMASYYNDHSILNTWGQRGTLHMFTPELWHSICDIYHDHFISFTMRYYKQLSLEQLEEIMDLINDKSIKNGSITKSDIIQIIKQEFGDEDLNYRFLIVLSTIKGTIFGKPNKPSIKQFHPFEKIFPKRWELSEINREKSLQKMMISYFKFYAPATIHDFVHWSGLTVSTAKSTLQKIRERLSVIYHKEREYFYVTDFIADIKNAKDNQLLEGKLFLLGKFDPLFVSYRHKDWIATEEAERMIWKKAGIVESVLIYEGSIIGTWRHMSKGNRIVVNISQFHDISNKISKKIDEKLEKLAFFWEKELSAVNYN